MNKTKILLIDDEPDVLEFLSYNLRKNNFEVEAAQNGLDGLDTAEWFKPDLIVSDIMMPKMDGIRMCENLRAMKEFKRTPIIFLSAIQDDVAVLRASLTADEFVSKPVPVSLLLQIIQANLKQPLN